MALALGPPVPAAAFAASSTPFTGRGVTSSSSSSSIGLAVRADADTHLRRTSSMPGLRMREAPSISSHLEDIGIGSGSSGRAVKYALRYGWPEPGVSSTITPDAFDRHARRELRHEIFQARRRIKAGDHTATERLLDAKTSRAEARHWDAETAMALEELRVADEEMTEVGRKRGEAEQRWEARRDEHHEEAVARSAKYSSDLAQLRLETQKLTERNRTECLRLQEERDAEQRSLEQRADEITSAVQRAMLAMSRSARHAAALLRPRGDMLEAQDAIRSTVDWLSTVDVALNSSTPKNRHGVDVDLIGVDCSTEAPKITDVCDAVRASASLMAVHWKAIVQSADTAETRIEKEKLLVDELHAAREQSNKFEEELVQRRQKLIELQQSIGFEDDQTTRILEEQRWFVPKVAAAIESMEEPGPEPSVADLALDATSGSRWRYQTPSNSYVAYPYSELA